MIANKTLIIFVGVVVLLLAGLFISRTMIEAQQQDWSQLSFSSIDTSFRFFDHKTGKIYIYDNFSGELVRCWQIDEIGKPLKKVPLQKAQKNIFEQ